MDNISNAGNADLFFFYCLIIYIIGGVISSVWVGYSGDFKKNQDKSETYVCFFALWPLIGTICMVMLMEGVFVKTVDFLVSVIRRIKKHEY